MKRTVILFLLIALPAVLFVVSPAAAGEQARETTSRFCSTYGDLGLLDIRGELHGQLEQGQGAKEYEENDADRGSHRKSDGAVDDSHGRG